MSTANPRRRPARSSSPSSMTLIDSFQSMSIRKGDTFHPNASEGSTEFWDPLESRAGATLPPARSTTCPKSLEDLLLGAGERRTAELLRKVDKAVKDQSKAALSNVLAEHEVLPVPTFTVHDTDATLRKTRTHSHGSDSGIGSSIASLDAKTATDTTDNESLARLSAATQQKGLSKYACEQIHKHIVKPILREQALKEFHPLIKEVPARIGNKDIKNLRDLEKTLIFLAPEYSRSPLKYLEFCERTIRVLHTTVTTLHESDQKAPADRPYTQGYFFDLVEQIRRYASILAATREKQAKGENTDEMDYSPEEKVSVLGGVSQNGKPAELVRHTKDGKVISLADDRVLSPDEVASSSTKRPMADFVDDEEALRSMARRKKNAKPEIHPCDLCDKEFKRPCDLTKHLKTHERPWKCPEPTCKYHDLGWPTEKERDRHANDKHSNAPPLYRCLFEPCPYTSKRESNCKQHMEKAHGWEYVRSKNNGKGKLTATRLPKGGNVPPSPASSTVLTPIAPSPSVQSWSASGSSRRESMGPPPLAGPSNWGTPALSNPSPDFSDHFNMHNFDFNFNDTSAFPITPAMSEEDNRRPSISSGSLSSGFQLDGAAFDEGISPEDLTFTNRFSFDDFAFPQHHQQVTPDSTTYSAGPSSTGVPHTSPGAQLDQTFTSEAMNLDGFNYGDFGAPAGDFTLYSGSSHAATSAEMFQPMPAPSSWGNFNINNNYNHNQQPSLNTGHSTLDELFPELKNH